MAGFYSQDITGPKSRCLPGWVPHLKAQGKIPPPNLTLVIHKFQFLAAGGLTSLLPCWLLAGGLSAPRDCTSSFSHGCLHFQSRNNLFSPHNSNFSGFSCLQLKKVLGYSCYHKAAASTLGCQLSDIMLCDKNKFLFSQHCNRASVTCSTIIA